MHALVHLGVLLGYVVSKEGKLPNLKNFFGYCSHAYIKNT
jgi:hypothetical protein